MFGAKYDGYLIRRPKISIVLDDVSADAYMASNNNFFYKFLTTRRHYGVFTVIVNVHSITVLFGKIRELFTAYCLFKDVNEEHIKMLFDTVLGMRREKFNFIDFKKIYDKQTGFADDIFD